MLVYINTFKPRAKYMLRALIYIYKYTVRHMSHVLPKYSLGLQNAFVIFVIHLGYGTKSLMFILS